MRLATQGKEASGTSPARRAAAPRRTTNGHRDPPTVKHDASRWSGTKLRQSKPGTKSIVREDNGREVYDPQDNSATDLTHRGPSMRLMTASRAVTAATPPSAKSQRGGRAHHSNAPFAQTVQCYSFRSADATIKSPVSTFMTWTALPITSAGRFSLWCLWALRSSRLALLLERGRRDMITSRFNRVRHVAEVRKFVQGRKQAQHICQSKPTE